MSLIRKPNELQINPYIKMLIYGQAGCGKTTISLSAPKPLLFDFDNGIHRVNPNHRVDTLQVNSYDEFLHVLNNEDLSEYQTLVIDTGGKCLDFMAEYIIRRNPRMGKANGSLTLQGYGERKMEFSALVKRISAMKKHIVFVAHRETKTEGDDTRYVPLFGGSNYDSLVTELDLVGYLEMNGTERTLTFNPTSRNDGKNTCNLPAMIKLPTILDAEGNPTAENDFIAENVIKRYTDNLKKQSEQNAKYQKLIEEINEDIMLTTDDLSLNDCLRRITEEWEHIGNSKIVAGRKLNERAKELNLTFNKESKKYEKAS